MLNLNQRSASARLLSMDILKKPLLLTLNSSPIVQKKSPQSSTLDVLPSEVMLVILQHLDIPSIKLTIKVYRRARILFSQYHKQIIRGFLHNNLLYDDVDFPSYFPQSFNGVEFPAPPETPSETSHKEAYKSLRYAKHLIALQATIMKLSKKILYLVIAKLSERLVATPKTLPEEELMTTIYCIGISLIKNWQMRVYKHPLTLGVLPTPFFEDEIWSKLPHPPHHEFEFSTVMAIVFIPREILPEELRQEDVTETFLTISGIFSTLAEEQRVINLILRNVRKETYRLLNKYLESQPIWTESRISDHWEHYFYTNVQPPNELSTFLALSPELLLQTLEVCEFKTETVVNGAKCLSPKQEKQRLRVASKLRENFVETGTIMHKLALVRAEILELMELDQRELINAHESKYRELMQDYLGLEL